MVQLLIVIISIAIVALGWFIIYLFRKLFKKLKAKRALKKAELQRLHDEEVEKIKQRYLALDKVVNLDEIEMEIKGNKKTIANFFKGIINNIRVFFIYNKVMQKIYKVIGTGWHYFCYIFWPIKWIKKKTYDKLRYEHQKVAVSILFLLPTLFGFFVFFLYPLIQSFIYSMSTVEVQQGGIIIHFAKGFTREAIQDKDYTNPSVTNIFFNYVYALRENLDFPVHLLNTARDTVIDTVVITIFSLLMAVMLNGEFKGRGLVRAIFFLPVLFNSQAITEALAAGSDSLPPDAGNALKAIFDLEIFLTNLRIPPTLVSFLGGITSTIYDTISYSGIQILIFLAAIQSVPKHLYEAAKIEGATKYESFWKITLPMVSPMVSTVIVYTVVDSFLRSEINEVIDLQYKNSEYGRHAAMSWIYLGVAALILVVMLGIVSKFVFYYDDKK